jgi:hypothetical protein
MSAPKAASTRLTWGGGGRDNDALPFMAKKPKPRRVRRARSIPLAKRIVTRAEFNRVIAILNERGEIINDLRHNQEMQFQRLAQLQAEMDLIRRAWEKSNRTRSTALPS